LLYGWHEGFTVTFCIAQGGTGHDFFREDGARPKFVISSCVVSSAHALLPSFVESSTNLPSLHRDVAGCPHDPGGCQMLPHPKLYVRESDFR
jgi:hypothetical protein